MQWYFNDLSLDGQFADPHAFRRAFEPLLDLRLINRKFQKALYCSKALSLRPTVTGGKDLRAAVYAIGDHDFTQKVLFWLTKMGPFWESERQPNDDDYFEYEGMDVTEQGLGEAARRVLVGMPAGVFSLAGSGISFDHSPLRVQQGLSEEPLAPVEVQNQWTVDGLERAVSQTEAAPVDWHEVIGRSQERFRELVFLPGIVEYLAPHPFNRYVAQRIDELLGVLNRLVAETAPDGRLSSDGLRLLNDHFVGDKAWFSGESDTNQELFERELTFPDPATPGKELFCPWHGKIKTPQYRIHFEWPRPPGQRTIKVVYIGPKITKR